MANEKRPCYQVCSWNDPIDGCIIPAHETCPMSNTEPDCSGWGNVRSNENRLISAEDFKKAFYADDACDEIRFGVDGKVFVDFKVVQRAIDEAPTVDAVEVVHGHWIDSTTVDQAGRITGHGIDCSVCDSVFKDDSRAVVQHWKEEFKMCPFCGAVMDGGDEDV